MIRKISLFIFSFIFIGQLYLIASPAINIEDQPTGVITMDVLVPDHQATRSELKDLRKNEKRMNRFENLITRIKSKAAAKSGSHSAGLFNDPVNRWFWLWIITWGIGIFLLVVTAGGLSGATLGLIWLLAFAIGSLSLIIWLVKKFG